MPTFETLLYSVEDGIATITLNRPDKLNAYNTQMKDDIIAAFDASDADDAVKAVIMTGSGARAFCSGADISAGTETFARKEGDDAPDLGGAEAPRDSAGMTVLRIYESKKPVIGAINGAAVGVGATMQLAMDVRIASKTARYGFVFARRGITLEGCSSWFLPRIVGPSAALEWCMSGRLFSADEALAKGLVSALYEPDDLLPAARAIAREIVDNAAPVSVSLTRQLIWRNMGMSHPMEAHIYESRALYQRGFGTDRIEGMKAFLEKRLPAYADSVENELPQIWNGWDAPEYR